MDAIRRKIDYLFSRLDGDVQLSTRLKRRVLQSILEIDPASERARELLDDLEGITYPDDPVVRAMEEVEWLANNGAVHLAKEGAECIRQEWGHVPVAKAWLSSVNALW